MSERRQILLIGDPLAIGSTQEGLGDFCAGDPRSYAGGREDQLGFEVGIVILGRENP